MVYRTLAEADQLATLALELAEQLRDDQYRVIALYARALLDSHLGRVEPARTRAAEALAIADTVSDALFAVQSRTVLGFLALFARKPEGGGSRTARPARLAVFERMARTTDFAWANAIEAMIGTGDLQEAETWLERYEDLAARSSSPWALAKPPPAAARCYARLAAPSKPHAKRSTERWPSTLACAVHSSTDATLLAAGSIRRPGA